MPSDVGDSTILKLDMNSMPILMVGVSGDRSLDDVKKIVDDKIIPRLERIDSAAIATVTGRFTENLPIFTSGHLTLSFLPPTYHPVQRNLLLPRYLLHHQYL